MNDNNDYDKILANKLEKLNNEYLKSGEYALGTYINYLHSLWKKRKYISLFRMIVMHFRNKKDKSIKKESVVEEQEYKYIIKNKGKYKIAVYTCITGNYDNVEEPLIMEEACDYFLFTNNSDVKSKYWNIRNIPENINKMGDNAKINRYIKMHPKEIFPEYDYAIYIDGNVKIISTISRMIEKINKNTGLAIHRHCQRNCIYKEIKACKAYGKGNYKKLKQQAERYKKDGFPAEYGMLECNVLVSDLNNSKSSDIFNLWWNEYLQSESMRDQIALPYILWKNKIIIEDIGFLGDNVNENCLIKINSHI